MPFPSLQFFPLVELPLRQDLNDVLELIQKPPAKVNLGARIRRDAAMIRIRQKIKSKIKRPNGGRYEALQSAASSRRLEASKKKHQDKLYQFLTSIGTPLPGQLSPRNQTTTKKEKGQGEIAESDRTDSTVDESTEEECMSWHEPYMPLGTIQEEDDAHTRDRDGDEWWREPSCVLSWLHRDPALVEISLSSFDSSQACFWDEEAYLAVQNDQYESSNHHQPSQQMHLGDSGLENTSLQNDHKGNNIQDECTIIKDAEEHNLDGSNKLQDLWVFFDADACFPKEEVSIASHRKDWGDSSQQESFPKKDLHVNSKCQLFIFEDSAQHGEYDSSKHKELQACFNDPGSSFFNEKVCLASQQKDVDSSQQHSLPEKNARDRGKIEGRSNIVDGSAEYANHDSSNHQEQWGCIHEFDACFLNDKAWLASREKFWCDCSRQLSSMAKDGDDNSKCHGIMMPDNAQNNKHDSISHQEIWESFNVTDATFWKKEAWFAIRKKRRGDRNRQQGAFLRECNDNSEGEGILSKDSFTDFSLILTYSTDDDLLSTLDPKEEAPCWNFCAWSTSLQQLGIING